MNEEKHKIKVQQKLQNEKYNTAFVVGNGVSRKPISLPNLKQHGIIYGCNALYRTFDPDYLIAVDSKMIIEINQSGYQHKHSVWTNSNKLYKNFKNFNYFDPSKGWSSGPTALYMASEHEYKKIYILGFDYKGLDDGKKVNNIYTDTKNYKRSADNATYYGNWLKQTITTIIKHPKIIYVRVIEEGGFIPKEMINIDNLTHETVESFRNKYCSK